MKFTRKKINKSEWHKKFAWLPTSVQDSNDKHTYVWLEKYMRKIQGSYQYKYSKKEWFKKKLAGDFDKSKTTFTDVSTGSFITGGSASTITIPASGSISSTTPVYSFSIDRDSGLVSSATVTEDVVECDSQIELDLGEQLWEDFTTEYSANIKKQQTDPRHNQW